MAVKNHKLKQTSKGTPEQSKSHFMKPGQPQASKFVVRLGTGHQSVVSGNKNFVGSGHKRSIHIKPLPPKYPDSLFRNKEEYDAMIQEVVQSAKRGEAIIRETPLAQEVN